MALSTFDRAHIPARLAALPRCPLTFAIVFGFLGADYMLIPLVTAESFGTASGKTLYHHHGLPLPMGSTFDGRKIFDARHSYDWRGSSWRLRASPEPQPFTRSPLYRAVIVNQLF
jgi:hypothetical protein